MDDDVVLFNSFTNLYEEFEEPDWVVLAVCATKNGLLLNYYHTPTYQKPKFTLISRYSPALWCSFSINIFFFFYSSIAQFLYHMLFSWANRLLFNFDSHTQYCFLFSSSFRRSVRHWTQCTKFFWKYLLDLTVKCFCFADICIFAWNECVQCYVSI